MSKSGVPGMAVAVVHDGKVVFAKGYGVQGGRETGIRSTRTPCSSWRRSRNRSAAPSSHTQSATESVKWTDPVVKYLPNFQLADPAVTQTVTIGDLYSHRSGIPTAAQATTWRASGSPASRSSSKLRYYPLNPFRITYGYTNFGMTTGGEAVAAAAGMPWEELSAKETLRTARA